MHTIQNVYYYYSVIATHEAPQYGLHVQVLA
jgi:hypothetical protein